MKSAQPLSLKARAIALLAQREHSRSELRRKLLRILRDQQARVRQAEAGLIDSAGLDREALATAGAMQATAPVGAPSSAERGVSEPRPDAPDSTDTAAAVEALLDWLQERAYLSEARFVDARIHARARRFGSQRIQQELAQHGVQLAPEQKAGLKDSELARAREVWQRKFGGCWPEDAAARAKQARFLAGRGFDGDVVRRVLRGPPEDEGEAA